MAEDKELYGEVSAISKEAAKQAEDAFDAYFDFLKRAISSYPSGGTKPGEKLESQAEQNVAAVHEYVKQLSQSKTVQDVTNLICRSTFPSTRNGDSAQDAQATLRSAC